MVDPNLPPGPLAGVRVLDLTDERAIYGAKLLADLNADVIRAERPGGDLLRQRGPFTDDDAENGSSLWHALYASNRRFVTVDREEERGRRLIEELSGWADIVIDCGWLAAASIDAEALVAANPSLVVVRVTSFGPDGPWADLLAPELVAAALGGFASTTGDTDTQPLTGFGELNFLTSGTYAAIAALTALRHVRESGEGQVVDVPVHSVIASCLEHVLMFYWHQEGRVLPRQGSIHWTSAYEVMAAQGGHVMVTPTPDFQRNIAWLVEEGVHEDLLDARYYATPETLGELLVPRVMEILRNWVATKDAEAFFFESQARHHPYGLVLKPEAVASNVQLAARQWWAGYEVGDAEIRGPGSPYRFVKTPWAIRRTHSAAGADSDDILAEIGWAE